jgi:hypothetical protein
MSRRSSPEYGRILIRATSPDRADFELDAVETIQRLLLHVPATLVFVRGLRRGQ